MIKSQKETILELTARIEACKEEIDKVPFIFHSRSSSHAWGTAPFSP